MGSKASPRAVSLVEVIVVVAIISVAAALAVPDIKPVLEHNRLEATAQEVAAFLDDARRRAVASGRCTQAVVPFSALGNVTTIELYVRDSSDCVNLASDGWVKLARELHLDDANVHLSLELTDQAFPSVSAGTLPGGATSPNEIVFRPNGRLRADGDLDATNDAVRVVVDLDRANASPTRTVEIDTVGHICVHRHDAAPPADTYQGCS